MIDPSLLDQLRQKRELAQEGETIEVQSPVAMKNPYVDLLRKRQKDADDEATVGSIASLVGTALSGDAMAEVADDGQKMIAGAQKRKRDLEDQESQFALAMEKARLTNGKKTLAFKPQLRSVRNPDGTLEYKYFMGPTDQPVPTGETVGLSDKLYKGTEGYQNVFRPGTGKTPQRLTDVQARGEARGISPDFRKEANKLGSKFINDTKTYQDLIVQAEQGYGLLMKKGTMPKAIALNQVVRLVEKGTLSNQDRTFITGQVGILGKISEEFYESKDNRFRQRKIEEAKEVFKGITERLQTATTSMANRRAEGFARTDSEKEYLLKRMMPGITRKPEFKAQPEEFVDANGVVWTVGKDGKFYAEE
jgi:hypothetical protein